MAEILHQLISNLSQYLQGFIHPRWCRISFINSMFQMAPQKTHPLKSVEKTEHQHASTPEEVRLYGLKFN